MDPASRQTSSTALPTSPIPPEGIRRTIEDNVLNSVPEAERRSGWALLANTAGLGTTLAILLVGGAASYAVGVWWAIAMAAVSAVFGAVLGTLTGRVSQATGTSSTVSSRFHGLGVAGSALSSLITSGMLVAFLALENALLYHGTLFMFGWSPTGTNAVVIYGVFTLVWIVLALFGVRLVQRTSLLLTVIAATLMITVTLVAFNKSMLTPSQVVAFHPPGVDGTTIMATLAGMMGMAGSLALVTADFTRYARSPRDVRIVGVGGSIVMNFVVISMGALLYQAGNAVVTAYLSRPAHAAVAAAQPGSTVAEKVQALASTNAGAYFIVLAGGLGFLVMFAAQIKAQVINAYTSSLSLTNLVDALTGRPPSRVLMLVVANAIALLAVWGNVLGFLNQLLGALGIATCALTALLICDHRMTRGRAPEEQVERVNWAGVVALLVGFGLPYVLFYTGVLQLAFLLAVLLTPALYVALRRSMLRPGTGTSYQDATAAMHEIGDPEPDAPVAVEV